jgi:hypothetical protein
MGDDDRALLRQRIRAALNRADEAFAGEYSDELQQLLGLSQMDLDKISPAGTTAETYNKLISVVREASRVNAAQADLADHIRSLGATAIGIAKLVPGLATVLAV